MPTYLFVRQQFNPQPRPKLKDLSLLSDPPHSLRPSDREQSVKHLKGRMDPAKRARHTTPLASETSRRKSFRDHAMGLCLPLLPPSNVLLGKQDSSNSK